MKILVVEDEIDIGKFLAIKARSLGHECLVATGGEEGLTLIQEQKFDLVFLDIKMPEVSGTIVMKELHESNLINKQFIVLISAFSTSDQEVNECLKLGAHSFLDKPIRPSKIQEKIDEIALLLDR